ncbi:helix-turn-helix domain-containing protein [Sporosarcina globispora]|uniref:helix-turn-helix domain-containing protein n=1 Tax=Sporosarcina globispora TaxID=1459 RepID=UPI0006A9AE80|nr:helix-turn-helix transcriptional regulator [Sporosarcina globispora]
MEKHNEVVIYLKDSVITDITNYIEYQKLKKLNFDGNYNHTNMEEFIVGCVCHYLRQLKYQIDLSGINDLGKPYRLKNRFKEYMDKHGIIPADLAKQTGIGASNISLILKNKNQPSLDYFLRIWMALKCPPLDKILYREEE